MASFVRVSLQPCVNLSGGEGPRPEPRRTARSAQADAHGACIVVGHARRHPPPEEETQGFRPSTRPATEARCMPPHDAEFCPHTGRKEEGGREVCLRAKTVGPEGLDVTRLRGDPWIRPVRRGRYQLKKTRLSLRKLPGQRRGVSEPAAEEEPRVSPDKPLTVQVVTAHSR